MAKFGYTCKCGWNVNRTGLTRKQYAKKKQAHAETCDFLATELSRTKRALKKVAE